MGDDELRAALGAYETGRYRSEGIAGGVEGDAGRPRAADVLQVIVDAARAYLARLPPPDILALARQMLRDDAYSPVAEWVLGIGREGE